MEVDAKVRLELMNNLLSASNLPKRLRVKTRVLAWEMTVRLAYLIKRGFDLAASATLVLLLAPLFIITGILIYLENPGPIFYTQIRVGKDGKHFPFYKFRSMVVGADKLKGELQDLNESKDGVIFKMKDDPRVTRVGKIIRKFSIDELPQLINVLRGDMSLVGPRPALPIEVTLYTLKQRKRLHALPGITGIWQVSGRSKISFSGQVRLDLEYIGSQSIYKDILILLKTIPAVISGDGAY